MHIERHIILWGSTMREGGGMKQPHHVQFEFDEHNGVCSSAIFHPGGAKFTSIFILRKHNCNLLSNGILRQRTTNRCGHKRYWLRCWRLTELRCVRLSSQATSGEGKLMVD
jgi:hypothetical protein